MLGVIFGFWNFQVKSLVSKYSCESIVMYICLLHQYQLIALCEHYSREQCTLLLI